MLKFEDIRLMVFSTRTRQFGIAQFKNVYLIYKLHVIAMSSSIIFTESVTLTNLVKDNFKILSKKKKVLKYKYSYF